MPFFTSKNADFILYNGDCMEVLGELPDSSVNTIFADPPYFLSNGGLSCKNGKPVCVDKGEWDKGGTPQHIYDFNRKWLALCRTKLKDDGTIWVSGTHHNIHVVMRCMQELGYKILNTITWQKSDPPPNLSCRYFNFSTELIIWARKSYKTPHKFNYDVMKRLNGGRQMTDVWRIPAVCRWEKSCGKHPTQKPLRLLYRIILASTDEGDIVLDPFAGSSTTGIAAILLGRKFIGIEKEPEFAELSIRRRNELDFSERKHLLKKKIKENKDESTVLVNHVTQKNLPLMLKTGITYVRAGDSRGSLLVRQGFERLGFTCLHTNGENPQLFPLSKRGFQIWTAEALRSIGFVAEHAPYYAVFHFDATHMISITQPINLHQRLFTSVPKIRVFSDFVALH